MIGAVGTQFSSNMTFWENSAGVAGGGVYISGVNLGLRLKKTEFISNSAIIGGGVYTTGSGTAITEDEDGEPQEHPTTLIECVFIDNKAIVAGGALDSAAGIDLIVDTTFMRNTAASGGALRLFGMTYLRGCEFYENVSDEDEGPGVFNDGVISEIANCSFRDNVYNCQPGSYLGYSEVSHQLPDNKHDISMNLHLEHNHFGVELSAMRSSFGTTTMSYFFPTPYAAVFQVDVPLNIVCKGCDTQCDECVVKGKEPMCHEEVEHSTATGGNVTMDFLSIEPGYWRATNMSIIILECYRTKACLGGITGKEDYCKEGYEGPCQ